jgi:hypothetical protein
MVPRVLAHLSTRKAQRHEYRAGADADAGAVPAASRVRRTSVALFYHKGERRFYFTLKQMSSLSSAQMKFKTVKEYESWAQKFLCAYCGHHRDRHTAVPKALDIIIGKPERKCDHGSLAEDTPQGAIVERCNYTGFKKREQPMVAHGDKPIFGQTIDRIDISDCSGINPHHPRPIVVTVQFTIGPAARFYYKSTQAANRHWRKLVGLAP